jgi:hypothetical protein
MSTDDLRAVARRNLKARNDFKVMLAIFAVVTVILVAIWFLTTGGRSYFWPVWPILAFVVASVFAGLDAYGLTRRHITEADIDAEVARMDAKRNGGGSSQT